MIKRDELQTLLVSDETYRIEKTISTTNMDKFCEAICAFSNDMPNGKQNGYLLIGVNDNGSLSGLNVTDELKIKISAVRSDGNILPLPIMNVESFAFEGGDVLVVEVTPSLTPPVRYRGRTHIRIGPRKGVATLCEERILTERASVYYRSFDTTPCREASIEDIDLTLFVNDYLPKAIKEDSDEIDNRTNKEKMAALRLFNLQYDCPTYAAVILFGKNPLYFLMGDYIQYVRYDGLSNVSDILNEFQFKGNLIKMLPKLDAFIETSLIEQRPVAISALKEEIRYTYPKWAIRELLMNAIMHRDYNSNTPTKLYQYRDGIEIVNAGGLFGNARPENFPSVNDYRNPIIAEALKTLGYVNKFNRGVARVQYELEANENGKAEFTVDKITVFEVKVKITDQDSNQDSNQDGNQDSNQDGNQDTSVVSIGENHSFHVSLSSESIYILEICNVTAMSKSEIFKSLGLTSQSKNVKAHLQPLLDCRFLIQTIKDKPTSRHQKYAITDLGREYLVYIKGIK